MCTIYRNLIPRVSQVLCRRQYAFKSDLKIKWQRPKKIYAFQPERSGDLKAFEPADPTSILPEYADSKELANANALVRKLFTLEFSPRCKTIEAYSNKVVSKVQAHVMDNETFEARIARWTATIRSLQERMEKHPRNKRVKVILQEIIDHRKKYLKFLRRYDYKRFEWLLDQLDLVYKPVPLDLYEVSRRDSLRKLTDDYCDRIKVDRLEAYKKELQQQQPDFLDEKLRTLEYIRQQQIECEVEPTVSPEDIANVKKQIQELSNRKDQDCA